MYNEGIKLRFIAHMGFSGAQYKFAVTLFNSLQKYEEQWGCDVCAVSEDKLSNAINEISSLRSSSLHTRINILRSYARWCIENNIPGATDTAMRVYPDNSYKIKTQMVSGPTELALYLDILFPPVSDLEVSILYRCYFWLAFSGMKQEDILKVKKSDINFNDMLIHFNGDDYPIYNGAINAFRAAIDAKYFRYWNKLLNRMIEIQRGCDDYLMASSGRVITPENIKSQISRRAKQAFQTGEARTCVSYIHAYLSGVFFRKFEMERAIGERYTYEDFLDIVDMNSHAKRQADRNKAARMYLEDYNTWKNAFNI